MSAIDTRNISRDSLFMLAQLRVEGLEGEHRVKVRNLSKGGMMATEGPKVACGVRVSTRLRNVGWVGGSVAWVQDDRFGIAFDEEIDAKLVRAVEAKDDFETPRFTRPSAILPSGATYDPERLRKV